MKTLDELWPPQTRVRETLGSDAHTLDEAVFLAVHQPMQFRRIAYGQTPSADSPVVDENQVLEALLADDGEGRVIVPIAGPSGVGKSHIIKWLQASLHARADRDRRHVILVPKSSSLKSVLRRILRDLEGPRYEAVRKRLERASDSLPEVAARDLRTRIVSVLKSDADAATERRRNRTSEDRRADGRLEWGRKLAELIDEPALWANHFYGDESSPKGIIARLAKNVTHEGSANRSYQFEPEDFDGLLGDLELEVLSGGSSGTIAKEVIRLQDERWRDSAAEVLNGVLDRATQNLLDLGGTPLSEVFLDLREALFEDGKELVILVEDFAVLSGMQGALLDALIHEARVGGQQKYCTIRSALAYTQGYQPMDRDTVRTRAGSEWIIEDTPGTEDEILVRSVEMVGAYLNAARWGLERLREHRDDGRDGESWLRVYESVAETEEEMQAVEAFGRSAAEYPLFPFNRSAIRALVREKCRIEGRLVFNPRLLIDRVVIDVLKMREYYEKRAFPPGSLGSSKVTAPQVTKIIGGRVGSKKDQQRTLTLVTYWAEVPDTASEAARIRDEVYEAFGLGPVNFGAPPPEKPKSPKQKAVGLRRDASPKPPTDNFVETWGKTLDAWQRGEMLPSKPARELRNYIAEALFAALPPDWPGTRPVLDRSRVAKDHVFLPNVRGGAGMEGDDVAIRLCSKEEWDDPLTAGSIRERLEAVIRFHGLKEETKSTWNWEGGEKAAALYADFVAQRRGPLMRWLVKRRVAKRRLEKYDITNLIENRLLAAALVGAGVSGGNHFESAVDVLFRELDPPRIHPARAEKWSALQREASEHAAKSREDLLDEFAAYQGSGNKVYAVDVARVEKPARNFMKGWELSKGPKAQADFERSVRRGIRDRREQLRKWRDEALGWMGDDLDKQEFIGEVRELLNQAVRSSLVDKEEVKKVRHLLDEFKDARVKETLGAVEVALREPSSGLSLAALAYEDGPTTQLVTSLGNQLGKLLDVLDRAIDIQLENSGAFEVQRVAEVVRQELDEVKTVLDDYSKVRSQ